MPTYDYELLNVFALADDPFSGNPLAVVRDADGLDAATCQAIARQFNLSETTFVYAAAPPSGGADPDVAGPDATMGPDAVVRVCTPSVELPFAGHPTLGTAYVVGRGRGTERVTLRMPAGDIPVTGVGDHWTLTANAARIEQSTCTATDFADAIGLSPSAVAGPARWVDSGLRQLLLQLHSPADVRAARPDPPGVLRHAMTPSGEALLYVWAWSGPDTVEARLFFSQDTAIVEDPATGSAAANFGGLLAGEGLDDRRVTIMQGSAVQRPSRLVVDVSATGQVRVGGLVRRVGAGRLELPGH
jgi:trans-2,3-dihydro-3-hydroxyanthranilate isomerase